MKITIADADDDATISDKYI